MNQSAEIAAVVTRVLEVHYATGGYAPTAGSFGKPGRWGCACGRRGPVRNGDRVVQHHRAHVGQQVAAAIAILQNALTSPPGPVQP